MSIEVPLCAPESTVWFILKKKQNAGELNKIKWSGTPQRTTIVDDHRIISLMVKNSSATSAEVRNTLEKVKVVKTGDLQHVQPLVTFKETKTRLDLERKHLNKLPMFWNQI